MTNKEKEVVKAKELGWQYIGSNLYRKEYKGETFYKEFKHIK